MTDTTRARRRAATDGSESAARSEGRGNVTRRAFLKGVGLGTAAVAVAGAVGARPDRAFGQSASPDPSSPPLLPADLLSSPETWTEPPVWSPIGFEPLQLKVVEDQNGFRFSYGGASPGPTIRMRGDETLYLRLQNGLSGDSGRTPVGPNPDPGEGYPGPEGVMLQQYSGDEQYGDGFGRIPTELQPDWSLGEHVNGVHSAHVTNLHTHGLHVAPGKNEDGTHSDDIFLRVVPKNDAVKIARRPGLYQEYQESRDEIIGSEAEFEFHLGDVMDGLAGPDGQPIRGLPHPPGTHWYHPHSHGATQNQVASGMAGFLIVTGDIDSALNTFFAGDPDASWNVKSGPYDYREREIFLQRTFQGDTVNIGGPAAGPDPDVLKKSKPPVPLVNGDETPAVILMRPGAVERWRVLNGSVDGAGSMRFAVLEGQFDIIAVEDIPAQASAYIEALSPRIKNVLARIDQDGGTVNEWPVTIEDNAPLTVAVNGTDEPVTKAPIHQLAWDGVTLMEEVSGEDWRYRVRDLSTVNDGVEPDFPKSSDCFKAVNMRRCFERPNEIAMGDANRGDVLFEAPRLQSGETAVYTVMALPTSLSGVRESTTKILAYVVVRGEEVDGDPHIPYDTLLDGVAVSPYELPVSDSELEIRDERERTARNLGDGTYYRTRVVRYAGWGSNTMPLVEADPELMAAEPENAKLSFYPPPPPDSTDYRLPVSAGDQQGVAVTNIRRYPSGELPGVVLPQNVRTMSIDGEKFFPTSQDTPRMLLDTAEEWAVFNQSIELYSVPSPDADWTADQTRTYLEQNPELVWYSFDYVEDPPGGAIDSPQEYFMGHRLSYPMTRSQVAAVNAARSAAGGDPWTVKGQLGESTGAIDHPFHIHQNPFWLMRVEVVAEDGEPVNILSQPRWADVVRVPRNGGRVVFRTRFVDYEGEFVDHCHILLHEDNGMMQRVQVTGDPVSANYDARTSVAGPDASAVDVEATYPKPTPQESWLQSLRFVDGNASGQVYPGTGYVPRTPEAPTE